MTAGSVRKSHEEEQSRTHFSGPVSDFTFWYASSRTAGSAYIASIVTQDPSVSLCDWTTNTRDVGVRYMDATNYFGGTIVDICDEDWTAGVADASNQIEPRESLELTHTPDPVSAIRVFINGMSHGSKVLISAGGQIFPIASVGNKLALKNAQNQATKNITSEAIKSVIPYLWVI